MNQVKKEKITDKDSFFNILNKAISSPTTLQKQIESDNYIGEVSSLDDDVIHIMILEKMKNRIIKRYVTNLD